MCSLEGCGRYTSLVEKTQTTDLYLLCTRLCPMNIFLALISWILDTWTPCACTIVEDSRSIEYHVIFRGRFDGERQKQGEGKMDV